jgi:Flp pilus assembly protein TadB
VSERAHRRDQPPRSTPGEEEEFLTTSIRRRRAAAAAERRRRLLTVDLGLGLVLALCGLLLAPGLAIVGLALILAAGGLLVSMLFGRLRRRRAGGRLGSVALRRSPGHRAGPERHG